MGRVTKPSATERAKALGYRVDLPDDAYEKAPCLCIATHVLCKCGCHKETEE